MSEACEQAPVNLSQAAIHKYGFRVYRAVEESEDIVSLQEGLVSEFGEAVHPLTPQIFTFIGWRLAARRMQQPDVVEVMTPGDVTTDLRDRLSSRVRKGRTSMITAIGNTSPNEGSSHIALRMSLDGTNRRHYNLVTDLINSNTGPYNWPGLRGALPVATLKDQSLAKEIERYQLRKPVAVHLGKLTVQRRRK